MDGKERALPDVRLTRGGALRSSAWLVMTCASAGVAKGSEPPGDTVTLPCRPTVACTAEMVPPGAFEFEGGALFRRVGQNERQYSFPFLAKLTAARWLQLQVGSNGYSVANGDAPQSFFDDALLGAKFHLVDQTALAPSISASLTAALPTFPGQGYVRTDDAFLTLYVTKDLGALHADLNVGEDLWRLEESPRPQEFAALALSTNIAPIFGVMAEVYYFTDASPLASRDAGVLLALSHSPKPWLTFDVGGDVGLFPSTRAYSLFFGMSMVPVLLWTSPAHR